MKCSKCPRKTDDVGGKWTKEREARAVADGWWFWDPKGPVEQLGVALCPDHNDVRADCRGAE